jgi:hypothetical protein
MLARHGRNPETKQGAVRAHTGVSGAVSARNRRTRCGPAAGKIVSSQAADGYEPVDGSGQVTARRETAMFRRPSAQPSRRAVLHVRAAGESAAPAELAAWYTERAFHFYLAGLRLPALAPVGARPGARYLTAALADLDAACAHLRQAAGMASVIVTARGRAATAAALWRDARADGAADALILDEPVLPAGVSLNLEIDCPVLVLSGAPCQPADPAPRGRMARRQRAQPGPAGAATLHLGGHVTWLRLTAEADSHQFFDELGRWLGAYMYGGVRDQLL